MIFLSDGVFGSWFIIWTMSIPRVSRLTGYIAHLVVLLDSKSTLVTNHV